MKRLVVFFVLGLLLSGLIYTTPAESAKPTIYNTETKKKLVEKILKQTNTLPKEFLEKVFLRPELTAPTIRITPECKEILRIKREEDEDFFLKHWKDKSVAYYREYQTVFAETKTKYGVPPEDILALLRTETYFGICNGSFPVLRQLYTLHHSPLQNRRPFFLRELIAFLQLSYAYNWDPYTTFGSETGALGAFQFMPSSIQKFAVDANQNGIIDIFDPTDVIPSIANFLVINHWKRSRFSSFWNYNRDTAYVQRVLDYADIIRGEIENYKKNVDIPPG